METGEDKTEIGHDLAVVTRNLEICKIPTIGEGLPISDTCKLSSGKGFQPNDNSLSTSTVSRFLPEDPITAIASAKPRAHHESSQSDKFEKVQLVYMINTNYLCKQ